MRVHCCSVSIIASKSRAIYVGMTNDLSRRVYEHKIGMTDGFSKKYRCHRLVYYESFDDVNKAIDREKQLKRWSRVIGVKSRTEAARVALREIVSLKRPICAGNNRKS
jgi:putative endonuclease